MNVYRLLRFIGIGRIPDSLKVFGVWLMYVSRRRMAAVFIDPVMACNLRCRMCYFSDPEKRASMSGTMADEELDQLERSMLPYAVKMQIGCGAEPTLYGRLVELAPCGELYANPLHPYTKELLSAIPVPDPLKERARKTTEFGSDKYVRGGRMEEVLPGHYVEIDQ